MTLGQWVGQWVGQWFGEWFGSGEPAPEGSLSGTATVGLTCTGPATAIGHLTGGAVITIASAGELSSATSGSLSGVATIALSTTGAITSANTRPSTSEYPFFSAGFWSAGFFSAGFWGETVPSPAWRFVWRGSSVVTPRVTLLSRL